MQLRCDKCGAFVTKEITKVGTRDEAMTRINKPTSDDEPDFSKGVMMPGRCTIEHTHQYWTNDEENGTCTPVGPKTLRFLVSEEDLTNIIIANESKGCCKLDYFQVLCKCGTELGHGRNDCWQDDFCSIAADVVNQI